MQRAATNKQSKIITDDVYEPEPKRQRSSSAFKRQVAQASQVKETGP
jgi:hypothetical protein